VQKEDNPMTVRPPGPGDAPLSELSEDDDTDLAWVSVRPDNGTIKGPLLKGAPLILIGALRMGLMMAKGRGTSAGSGGAGLVIGVLAFTVPLLWVGALSGLRWANAGIRLADGVLTVRNLWNRRVLAVPVSSLTGLHTVRLPLDGVHTGRILITSKTGKPLVIDTRLWDPEGLKELWRGLGLAFQDHGRLDWSQLHQRFPGVRMPWRQVHYVVFTLLIVIGAIAYIALIVNLPFLV
jgi:hypothetical protein